ncbi:MAG: L,D-transpeptidase [Hyphomicrobiales bacterium]|nr:L,D-transpeptidase [Hyphomicrobiales bacterium]
MGGAAALAGCTTDSTNNKLKVAATHGNQPHFISPDAYVKPGHRDLRPANLLAGNIPKLGPFDRAVYAGMPHDIHPIPPLDFKHVDLAFLRSVVLYPTSEKAGTIYVIPHKRFLYLTLGDGRAIRYGVGVGRAGFAWKGIADVRIKREWPRWIPPEDMIVRQPELKKYAAPVGMPGGINNPLGARAHYLWEGNQDTYYRIHGTNEPESIGHAMSSGCIRMHNLDVVDLYSRVNLGTKVIVT